MTEHNNINTTPRAGRERPLSPHLQVYRLPITAVLSILHRASIIVMYFTIIGFTLVLADYAFVAQCQCSQWLKSDPTGIILTKIALSGLALAASYWFFATIRHILSDLGYCFNVRNSERAGVITIIMTFITTAAIIYAGGLY